MTREELLAWYNQQGRNFMTKHVLAKRVLPSRRTVIELAQGEGMRRQPIYGVSVLICGEDGKRDFAAEKANIHKGLYQSLPEAERHYNDA